MEPVSYVPTLARLHLSMDTTGAHYKDVLRLGPPFHLVLHTSTPMHGQRTECSSDGECSLKLTQS